MKIITRGIAALSLLAATTPAIAASHVHEDAAAKAKIATVEAFYDAALNKKDFDAAKVYLGPVYIQHNPSAADGAEGLKGFIGFMHDKFPDSHSDIKAAFVDGDYVILHVWSVRTPGTAGTAIFDLFRLDHGKIVEHWDARQDVPDKSVNTNTMF